MNRAFAKGMSSLLILVLIPVFQNQAQEKKSDHPPVRLQDQLRDVLKNATIVRLKDHFDEVDAEGVFKPRLLEIKDASKVKALVNALVINDGRGTYKTDCEFVLTLEFADDKGVLAKLGFETPYLIRWYDGKWDGDAQLTADSCKDVCQWLRDQGRPEHEKTRVRAIQQYEKRSRRFNGLLSAFPKECQPVFAKPIRTKLIATLLSESDFQEHIDELSRIVGSNAKLAACVFRAMGNDNPARERDVYDMLLELLLKRCKDGWFEGLKLIRDEPRALVAASTLFIDKAVGSIPKKEQDEWLARICNAILGSDSQSYTRKLRALEVLSGQTGAHSLNVLRSTMAEPRGKKWQSADERDPSLQGVAAIWLGVRGDKESQATIRDAVSSKLPESDQIAFEIALSFFDHDILAEKHFLKPSAILAEGACRSAVRMGGKRGMDQLILNGLSDKAPNHVTMMAFKGSRILAAREFSKEKFPKEDSVDAIRAWWEALPKE